MTGLGLERWWQQLVARTGIAETPEFPCRLGKGTLQEYRQAPRVTRERLYLETMESVLGTVDKVLIDSQVDILPLLNIEQLAGP